MRARLARAVEKEWQKSPERFERLREALASETPGAVDWIEGLLAAGASPNANFEPLHTALAAAAHHGFADRVLVLAPKSDANLVSQEGLTALSRAAAAGNAACVQILLAVTNDAALGATVKDRDALAMAVENNHPECVKLLLDRCDPDRVIDKQGTTLLMHAVSRGFEQCVKALLTRCDVKKKNKQGCDALKFATHHQRLKAMALLLRHAIPPVSIEDKESAFALALAGEKWMAVDQFAGHVPRATIDIALSMAPGGMLPAMLAVVEGEELAREIARTLPVQGAAEQLGEAGCALKMGAIKGSICADDTDSHESSHSAKRPARRV